MACYFVALNFRRTLDGFHTIEAVGFCECSHWTEWPLHQHGSANLYSVLWSWTGSAALQLDCCTKPYCCALQG